MTYFQKREIEAKKQNFARKISNLKLFLIFFAAFMIFAFFFGNVIDEKYCARYGNLYGENSEGCYE